MIFFRIFWAIFRIMSFNLVLKSISSKRDKFRSIYFHAIISVLKIIEKTITQACDSKKNFVSDFPKLMKVEYTHF